MDNKETLNGKFTSTCDPLCQDKQKENTILNGRVYGKITRLEYIVKELERLALFFNGSI